VFLKDNKILECFSRKLNNDSRTAALGKLLLLLPVPFVDLVNFHA
jgi:hypothetical protein